MSNYMDQARHCTHLNLPSNKRSIAYEKFVEYCLGKHKYPSDLNVKSSKKQNSHKLTVSYEKYNVLNYTMTVQFMTIMTVETETETLHSCSEALILYYDPCG